MTSSAKPKPVITTSRAVWRGERRFDAGPAGRTAPVDADSRTAPGPVESLLNAITTCSGVDVLDILEKRRTPVERFEVHVSATRRAEAPRRVERLALEFHIDGPDVEEEHAERAIQLSFDRYCSVAASLAPDIVVESTLILNGDRFAPRPRSIWRMR
jgi:putative redox protein